MENKGDKTKNIWDTKKHDIFDRVGRKLKNTYITSKLTNLPTNNSDHIII